MCFVLQNLEIAIRSYYIDGVDEKLKGDMK